MTEYPKIEPTARGLIVHMSKGAKLPGVFLNYLQAEKAISKYKNKQKTVSRKQTKKMK